MVSKGETIEFDWGLVLGQLIIYFGRKFSVGFRLMTAFLNYIAIFPRQHFIKMSS